MNLARHKDLVEAQRLGTDEFMTTNAHTHVKQIPADDLMSGYYSYLRVSGIAPKIKSLPMVTSGLPWARMFNTSMFKFKQDFEMVGVSLKF